jgi:hypothetical protein
MRRDTHHSPEAIQKMRESHIGQVAWNKGKPYLSGERNPMYGKHLSDATKQKIRESLAGDKSPNFGKHLSEITKQKLREKGLGRIPWNKGKHGVQIYSEDMRKKISNANRGKPSPNRGKHPSTETRQKLIESHKGKHPSEATRQKMSEANSGEKHYMFGKHYPEWRNKKIQNEKNGHWKGDKVGYDALHDWIQKYKPKVDRCEECNEKKRLYAANISGEYKRDINDFRWLCAKCHTAFDRGKQSKRKVMIIREIMLQRGDRIELIEIHDEFTNLKKGDRGTVVSYMKTPWELQILIKWDTGSNLMLLEGVDKYRKLTEGEMKKEMEEKQIC